MKYWILAAASGIAIFAVYAGLQALMKAKWNEGYQTAISIQANTDRDHLVAWAADQQKINAQALDAFNHVNSLPTGSITAPVNDALVWVRETAKPARKPIP